MTLGNKIAELRKGKGLTQEALANKLGVSNQAVSKWEANQSCPDIQLLPQIADLFEISLDALFGRGTQSETEEHIASELPWEDDGKLRAVIYVGHSLIGSEECEKAQKITFEYEGPALDIISSFSVTCDEVQGNVSAGADVTCDTVYGNVSAGCDVTCDDVYCNVGAGGDVTCDEVRGNVNAGGDVQITKAFVHAKNKLKKDMYTAQAKENWGKTEAYKEFEEKSKDWTEDTTKNIAKDMMALFVEFGQMKDLDPADEKVQAQVKKLQDYITENFYNCTPQILSGLGKMYSSGGEFTDNIDNAGGEGTAEFTAKAINIYCESV